MALNLTTFIQALCPYAEGDEDEEADNLRLQYQEIIRTTPHLDGDLSRKLRAFAEKYNDLPSSARLSDNTSTNNTNNTNNNNSSSNGQGEDRFIKERRVLQRFLVRELAYERQEFEDILDALRGVDWSFCEILRLALPWVFTSWVYDVEEWVQAFVQWCIGKKGGGVDRKLEGKAE